MLGFSFRSLVTQIVFGAGVCLLGLSATVIGFAAVRSGSLASDAAVEEARLVARQHAESLTAEMACKVDALKSLRAVLERVNDKDRTVALSREDVARILQGMLAQSPTILGSWSGWEPNAFDGRDDQWKNKPWHDASGRFMPYVFRAAGGKIDIEPLRDYDDQGTAGAYYQRAKKEGACVIVDPYTYAIDGKDTLITSLCEPVKHDGKFIAVVGFDMALGDFQTKADEADLFDRNGRLSLISPAGKVVCAAGHPDQVGKPLDRAVIGIGEVPLDKPGVATVDGNLVVVEPIRIGETPGQWAAVVSVPFSVINAASTAMIRNLILIGVTTSVFALSALWFTVRRSIRPLRLVSARMRDIAEGEGDLTRRLDDASRNEVGEVARGFNAFVNKVRTIVSQIAASTNEVAAAATQIAASSEEMSAAAEQVARESVRVADTAIQAQRTAEDGGKIVSETVSGIGQIDTAVTKSAEAVMQLGARSDEIGQIIGVINDIADQTNLLALNAAIEAARAGEHGRGFAVVADEVRKLAERTTKATEQVSVSIKTIQSETSGSVARMKEGTDLVRRGVDTAAQAGRSLEQIVTNTKDVSAMVNSIASAAKEAGAGSSQAATAAESLSSKAEQLRSIVQQFKY